MTENARATGKSAWALAVLLLVAEQGRAEAFTLAVRAAWRRLYH